MRFCNLDMPKKVVQRLHWVKVLNFPVLRLLGSTRATAEGKRAHASLAFPLQTAESGDSVDT